MLRVKVRSIRFLSMDRIPVLDSLPRISKQPHSKENHFEVTYSMAEVNIVSRNKRVNEAPLIRSPEIRKNPEVISKKGIVYEKRFIAFSGNIPYFATVRENSIGLRIFRIPEYMNRIPMKISRTLIHILLKRNFFTG